MVEIAGRVLSLAYIHRGESISVISLPVASGKDGKFYEQQSMTDWTRVKAIREDDPISL
jgi:hypothetical protein